MAFSSHITFITVNARFHITVAMCDVMEGTIRKGDTVRFLDAQKQPMATGVISAINLRRKAVAAVTKGDEPLMIGLEFRDNFDTAITTAKYITD